MQKSDSEVLGMFYLRHAHKVCRCSNMNYCRSRNCRVHCTQMLAPLKPGNKIATCASITLKPFHCYEHASKEVKLCLSILITALGKALSKQRQPGLVRQSTADHFLACRESLEQCFGRGWNEAVDTFKRGEEKGILYSD